MERYKSEILTVDKFLTDRPDLAIHTETTIQSAIYNAAMILNSECNNLISEVWEYNKPVYNEMDGGIFAPDPSSYLYRTEYELTLIRDAFIIQTQYNINLGNDFTTGAISGSIGNVNYSSSRNESQKTIAPAVLNLLAKARVYVLNDFMSLDNSKKFTSDFYNDCSFNIDKECYTIDEANKKFVEEYQPNVKAGRFLSVNQNGFVEWVENEAISEEDKDKLKQQLAQNQKDIATTTQKVTEIENKLPTFATIDEISQISEQLANDYSNNETLQAKLDTLSNDIKQNDIKPIETKIVENRALIDGLTTKTDITNSKVDKIENYLDTGYIIKFRGKWDFNTNYEIYDYVLYENKTYFALRPNNGKTPTAYPYYWKEQIIQQNIDLSGYYEKVDTITFDKVGGVWIKNKPFDILPTVSLNVDGLNIAKNNNGNLSRIAISEEEIILETGTENDGTTLTITSDKINGVKIVEDINDVTNKEYVDNINNDLMNRYKHLEQQINFLEQKLEQTNYLFARVSLNDGNLKFIGIEDIFGVPVDNGTLNFKRCWGYTNQENSANVSSGNIKLGGSTSYTTVGDYQTGFVYFFIGIETTYEEKKYYGAQYVYTKHFKENDYISNNNEITIPLKLKKQ